MDAQRFDDLARALATGYSRRRLLAGLGAGALALAGRTAGAQACRAAGSLCAKPAHCCSDLCDTTNSDPTKRNRCACPSGTETCRGACKNPDTDYLSDVNNCGDCGVRCPGAVHASPTCTNGVCGTACVADYEDCGGTCVAVGGCCIDGAAIAAGTINPANACQACLPATSTTTWINRPNGTGCDDRDACTQTDTCQQGVCVGGNVVPCPQPTECQQSVTCNPASGACDMIVNKGAGAPCGAAATCVNGVFTPGGQCDGSGACVPGTPVSCEPYACNAAGTACRTTCTVETDCADCADCVSERCTPPAATLAECGGRCDEDPLIGERATVTRCGQVVPCPHCNDCDTLGCTDASSAAGTVGPRGQRLVYCFEGGGSGQICHLTSECPQNEIYAGVVGFFCVRICLGD